MVSKKSKKQNKQQYQNQHNQNKQRYTSGQIEKIIAAEERETESQIMTLAESAQEGSTNQSTKTPRAPLGELGAVGQSHSALFAALGSDEYLAELRWPQNITVYEKMRRSDSQIQAMLLALELPLRSTKWLIEPYSDDAKDIEVAEFIEENLFTGPPQGMTQHWDDFLRLALTMFWAGHSVFEKVFEIKDGYVRWRKFAQRPHKTIYDFLYDENGGPLGIRHLKVTRNSYEYVDIPIEKLLLFSHRMEGGDLRGHSVLRAAYKHWKIKDFLYKILNIGIERNLVGTPTMELPEAYSENDKKLAKETVTELRSAEKAGALIPFGFKLDLFEGKRGMMEVLPYIQHQDLMIVRGVLAQFLNLGSSDVGSFALSKDQSDLFLMTLNASGKYVANTINSHAIPQLVDWNFDVEGYPNLAYKPIGQTGEKLVETLTKLAEGKLIVPDDNIEEWLRDMLDLPEKGEALSVPGSVPMQEGDRGGKAGKVRERINVKGKEQGAHSHSHNTTSCLCGAATLQERKQGRTFNESVDAAGNQTMTRKWRRDLTAHEKIVNFVDIEKTWDTEEEKFVTTGTEITQKQITDLLDRIRKAIESEDYDELAKIPVRYRGEFTKFLTDQQRSLIGFGITQAAKELGIDEAKAEKIKLPSDERKVISARAGIVADQIAQRIKTAATLSVLDAVDAGQPLKVALFAAKQEAERVSARELVSAASVQVGDSLNHGRMLAADVAGVELAQYSAILDDKVCPLCEYLDGMVIELTNPDYDRFTPRLHQHCRCVWVYIKPGEDPQPSVTWETPGEDMVVEYGSLVP